MTAIVAAWTRLTTLLAAEIRHLFAVTPSDRPWHMPAAAAMATGLPLLIGAYFGHLDFGLVSSLGGLVFLYMPATPMAHRMVMLMACAFAMSACYALGVLSHFVPVLMMPALVFIAVVVTMCCRLYGVGPPGSLFFVMAAAIGAYTPVEVMEVPLRVGLMTMGGVLACLIGFCYSLYSLRLWAPKPVPALPPASFDYVVFDSVVIGSCVGLSLALAQMLALENAYWVPVSCLAVIQGASLRAVWTKQVHRAVGTGGGLLLAWGLLVVLPLESWVIAFTLMALAFIVETLVVRHYGAAVIFITPLTLLLAEAGTLGHGVSITGLIEARFIDTVLGGMVGLAGGACLHSTAFRRGGGGLLRRLIPARFAVRARDGAHGG